MILFGQTITMEDLAKEIAAHPLSEITKFYAALEKAMDDNVYMETTVKLKIAEPRPMHGTFEG